MNIVEILMLKVFMSMIAMAMAMAAFLVAYQAAELLFAWWKTRRRYGGTRLELKDRTKKRGVCDDDG